MNVKKIELGETGLFSPLFLDLINRKGSLNPFYSRSWEIENFEAQLKEKQDQFSMESRKVLVSSLQKQYEGLEIGEEVQNNLISLSTNNTFTITTGHQLNVFTGPLYFIYKIVTVINACKELKAFYPDYNFVPVYWMASEDHDFEEISYFNLYGKKYVWETDQAGAVGRFDPASLKSVLDSMPGSISIFERAYLGQDTLANAVRSYVNELFGDEGIVVLDGDDVGLKSQFIPVLKDELLNQASYQEVLKDTDKLIELGYKPQISVREINLFYLDEGIRERIIKNEDGYEVLNSDLRFSEEEILKLLNDQSDKFSPNVILRPLFQEIVLPNLAYVGGPAEAVYWLQLRSMFKHFKVPFPILLPRNFVLYIDHVASRKLGKTGLKVSDLFDPINDLIERHVKGTSDKDIEFTSEQDTIRKIFGDIQKKATNVDSTLEKMVKAETQRVFNSLDKIEKKVIKAEKRHHDDHIGQLEDLKSTLFPGGGPQERSMNFLNFYLEDPEFIKNIKASLSSFDLRYHVILDGSE
jgi:bacillithiol biosynthesis cysteine-adding enzyme BshC